MKNEEPDLENAQEKKEMLRSQNHNQNWALQAIEGRPHRK